MNLFIQELKWNLKTALIWGVALSMAGIFFLSLYPSFANDMDALDALLAQYPPEVLKALGMGVGGMGSFLSFYGFVLVYIILCGAIQGLIVGIQVIGKESSRKTCDFLFTKPASRIQILVGKFASALLCVLISGLLYAAVSAIFAFQSESSFDKSIFALLTGAVVLTQLLFTSIGFCIGCFLKKAKSPVFIGIGVGALFFGVQMAANMFDEKALNFFSPMGYLNPSYIIAHSEYDATLFICLLGLAILLTVLGIWRYQTKDIHSA